MAKNSVADWDATAANNTDIGGIDVNEGCPAANLNNMGREIMAQVKAYSVTVPALSSVNTYTQIQKWAKGADVASATALTLGDDGNYFDITGTTAITSIVTKGVGTRVLLQFDAALTLTHSAADLILPGGANITTAAGDHAEFVEYATGDWRCVNYQHDPFFLLDEDDFASDSASKPPSQQSAKAYISARDARFLHVRDQKTSGTLSGSSSSGTQVRVLNTTVENSISGASGPTSNQVTLPAGTYDVFASAPIVSSNRTKIWIRTAGGTVLVVGPSHYAVSGSPVIENIATVQGRITLASSTAIEIAQYAESAKASNGLGIETSSGQVEVYAELMVWQVD